MASTSLKIYNDTVLKQSVLQGYEIQRTNDNLGRFTMGELAFTRDTGRLFVGNYTTNTTDNTIDSKYVSGGILTGNKYLGFIDSKPLIHFSTSGSTGWKPLDYENDTTDEMLGLTEPALFGSKSRFRQEDDGRDGTNGWNKKSEYIQKYGVYSGDYTFDIYNNAFILFDKNITTNKNAQPKRQVEHYAQSKNSRKFVEKILDQNNNDVSSTAKRRTPLYDDLETANADYPIYGDGYVIMRVLEPDGTTIGYKDRTFLFNGNYNADGSPTNESNTLDNWSHNILTIKHVPASTLTGSFDQKQFINTGTVIKLNSTIEGVTQFKGNALALPQTIQFPNDSLQFDTEPLSFNFITKDIKYANPFNDYIFTLTPSGNSKNEYNVSLAQQYLPNYKIYLHDGLINTQTGDDFLEVSIENSNAGLLHIGRVPDSGIVSTSIGCNDPFGIGTTSKYIYSGIGTYTASGTLEASEEYDLDYAIAAKNEIAKYDTTNNAAYNLLKNPIPICWNSPIQEVNEGTSSAKLDFIISPHLHCIKKKYTGGTEESIDTVTGEPITIQKNYTSTSSYYDTDIIVLGNNTYASSKTTSDIPLIDGFSYSINNTEIYNTYVKDSTSKANIVVMNNIDFGYDESGPEEIVQQIATYKTTRKYDNATSTWIEYDLYYDDMGREIYKKNGTWLFNDETITGEPMLDGEALDEEYPSRVQASLAYRINDTGRRDVTITPPEVLTRNWFTQDENKNIVPLPAHEAYSSIFSVKEVKMTDDEGETSTKFVYHTSDNDFDDFSSFFTEDMHIQKVEISTSSTNASERWTTLFDSTSALSNSKTYTATATKPFSERHFIYNPSNLSTVVINSYDGDAGEKVIIHECVYNSNLFVRNTYAPYVLRIKYDSPLGVKERLFPLKGDIIYNNNILLTYKDDLCYYADSVEIDSIITFTNSSSTKIAKENIQTDFFDRYMKNYTSGIIDASAINNISGFALVSYDEETISLSTDYKTTVKNNTTLYTWYADYAYVNPTSQNQNLLRCYYRATGDKDTSSDNFIIEKVEERGTSQNDEGESTTSIIKTYTWSSASGKTQITKLLNNKAIFIPTEIIISYKTSNVTYYSVKKVPTHGEGYVYPTSGLSVQNKVIIPDMATSLVCEIHHFTEKNKPISIYSSGSMLTLSEKFNQYSFPFNLNGGATSLPTLITTSSIGSNEKIIYNSNTSDVQVIDIPLYRTTMENSKGCSIRVANMPCGNTKDKFLMRVIGYRV